MTASLLRFCSISVSVLLFSCSILLISCLFYFLIAFFLTFDLVLELLEGFLYIKDNNLRNFIKIPIRFALRWWWFFVSEVDGQLLCRVCCWLFEKSQQIISLAPSHSVQLRLFLLHCLQNQYINLERRDFFVKNSYL